MKILLIGFSKIKYMPYANFYLDNIDQNKHEVHFLYWNRDAKEEDLSKYRDIVLHPFECFQEDQVLPIYKARSFLKYKRFATEILNKHAFDLIIILHSMPGILLYRTWSKKYRGKYIFDYRDSTYERFRFYKKMIGNIVKSSIATFTSSDGFRKVLPDSEQAKIYTSHNLLMSSLSYRNLERTVSARIRVAFWGFIREEALNRKIIEKFAADDRFELHYYGREQSTALKLKEFVKQIHADNVFFHGEYTPEERYEFVCNTDLLHNIYATPNMMLAMGNKYYDGIVFSIPQLCMLGSFMGYRAEKAGVGLACDPSSELFTQTVYDYYAQIKKDAFSRKCDRELSQVLEEYQKGIQVINTCLQETQTC